MQDEKQKIDTERLKEIAKNAPEKVKKSIEEKLKHVQTGKPVKK